MGVNFSGGEDISQLVSKKDYDHDTNYVWENLLRESTEKISKDDLETMLSLQYEFADKKSLDLFGEANTEYLLFAMDKLQIHAVDRALLEDFFDTLKMYQSK